MFFKNKVKKIFFLSFYLKNEAKRKKRKGNNVCKSAEREKMKEREKENNIIKGQNLFQEEKLKQISIKIKIN